MKNKNNLDYLMVLLKVKQSFYNSVLDAEQKIGNQYLVCGREIKELLRDEHTKLTAMIIPLSDEIAAIRDMVNELAGPINK